jgi:hypothetical protein
VLTALRIKSYASINACPPASKSIEEDSRVSYEVAQFLARMGTVKGNLRRQCRDFLIVKSFVL